MERLDKSKAELEDREEKAEEALAQLQEQLAEAVSRLRRIRQLKKTVAKRSDELFARGMQELADADQAECDRLISDAFESGVAEMELGALSSLAGFGASADEDWSSFGLGPLPEESVDTAGDGQGSASGVR